MLKKEFKEEDIQRIRNIVTNKTGDNTRVQSGYKKQYKKYKEGDVWKEDDRTWTIKNGIKQNITKLDKAKEATKIPLLCPSCGKPMKHHLDKKMYKIHKTCMDCVAKAETEIRRLGKWHEYEKAMIGEGVEHFIKDYEQMLEDLLNQQNEGFVTEAGDVEKWKGSIDKAKVKTNAHDFLSKLRDSVQDS